MEKTRAEEFDDALYELEKRQERLDGARAKLGRDREELMPLQAFVSAKQAEHDKAARDNASEERSIAADAKQLARDIAQAAKGAERQRAQERRDAAAKLKLEQSAADRAHKAEKSELAGAAKAVAAFQAATAEQ